MTSADTDLRGFQRRLFLLLLDQRQNHAMRLAEDREAHPEFYTEDFYEKLAADVARRRKDDPEFVQRIRQRVEEDAPVLERLKEAEEAG